MNNYLYEYDDPYKILAHAIVGFYRPADVVRMLTDNAFILNCVVKEVRDQDMCGHFVDCIIEDILEKKSRMEYMNHLDKLAKYYYTKLDKERLRKEIRLVLEEVGIEVGDYSAGSVSSDKQ